MAPRRSPRPIKGANPRGRPVNNKRKGRPVSNKRRKPSTRVRATRNSPMTFR